MITFLAAQTGLRITGGDRAISVFTGKPVDAKDILLASTPEENPTSDVLSWPGEYDRSGIAIKGVGQNEGQTVSFVVSIDGTRIAAVAAPLQDWSEADVEHLGEVAVLVVPAQDAKRVQSLVDDVDPRVLVLVPGEDDKLDQDVLKAVGAVGKEQVSEFKLKSLPQEGREVVILTK